MDGTHAHNNNNRVDKNKIRKCTNILIIFSVGNNYI